MDHQSATGAYVLLVLVLPYVLIVALAVAVTRGRLRAGIVMASSTPAWLWAAMLIYSAAVVGSSWFGPMTAAIIVLLGVAGLVTWIGLRLWGRRGGA